MKHWTLTLIFGVIASAAIAGPILAQRGGGGDRPSRACMQEIRKLCAQSGRPDRSAIRACLQEKSDQLSSGCRTEVAERVQQRRQQSRNNAAPSAFSRAKNEQTIFYGAHQRQQIDIYKPEDAVDDLPLILYIHGGGWTMGNHKRVQTKPQHFVKGGYIFASTGYRLVPEVSVEEQAKDIGLAIQALAGQANALGIDPTSIIVMGHSAGAHLAALVSSDPSYAGNAFAAIKGVILLDGAGYDIPTTMKTAASQSLVTYKTVFGNDPDRHNALSPLTHVGGRDAPYWLALYVEERVRSKAQTDSLVEVLVAAGMSAKAAPIANTDHGRLNREIGTPSGTQQTAEIDAFLAGLTAL